MMSSCDPGRGSPPWCNVSRATIFGSHDPFAGFRCGRHGHMAAAKYIPGWSAGYEVYFDVVRKVNATVTIEVGVWKGLSTAYMASGVRARDRGGVHFAVDTWLGDSTMWLLIGNANATSRPDKTRSLNLIHGRPSIYHEFMCNMVDLGLQPFVVPLSLPSVMAAQVFARRHVTADVVHIDASHEYEDVVADLRAWWPRVRCGGILLGDDYNRGSHWPGVRRAVNEFVMREGLRLRREGPQKWAVQKREC
jgi:hypothetical protein